MLQATFQPLEQVLAASLQESLQLLEPELGEVLVINYLDPYEGMMAVTPGIQPQALPTQGKYLSSDILILGIETREEVNQTGGTTLIIGG